MSPDKNSFDLSDRYVEPDEVKAEDLDKNILEVAESEVGEGEGDLFVLMKAEEKITGSSHLPKGKTRPQALITGGSSGIGRGVALILAEAGYDVAITYHSGADKAEEVKRFIEKRFTRRCEIYELDTAKDEQIQELVRQVKEDFGGIDVLVNNAGITIMEDAFEDKIESMDKLLAINFRGAMIMLQETAKVMKDQEFGGSIINVSSIHADHEDEKDAIYGATKAAMERASKTYALQYGPYNIRVNTIAPGAILIDRTTVEGHKIEDMMKDVPLGRSGLPRDIAHAVLFLASERASYITGISLLIDGGMALG